MESAHERQEFGRNSKARPCSLRSKEDPEPLTSRLHVIDVKYNRGRGSEALRVHLGITTRIKKWRMNDGLSRKGNRTVRL
jgi:hypothetical protein